MRYARPVSRAAFRAQRLSVFSALLLCAAGMAHYAGRLETQNFIAILLVGGVLAACALVLSCAGLWSLWVRGAKGGRAAFWALLLALLVLVPLGWGLSRYHQLPALYDIATDVAAPPAFIEAPPVMPAWWIDGERRPPDDAAMLQRAAYPDLSGRRYEGAMDRVIAAVRHVAGQRGFVMTHTEGAERFPKAEAEAESRGDPESEDSLPSLLDLDAIVVPLPLPAPRPPGDAIMLSLVQPPPPSRVLLQGVAASPGLAVLSDIAIRLTEEEETTYVDMRAVSRTGNHDLGLNAWHITRFFAALDAELHGVAE